MATLPPLQFTYRHGGPLEAYIYPKAHGNVVFPGAATATGLLRIGTRPSTILYTFTGPPEVTWDDARVNEDGTTGAFAILIEAAALPMLLEGTRYHADFWIIPSGGNQRHQLDIDIEVKSAL